MKLIFGSDFHGNLSQYDKIFQASKDHSCDAILLGGDLAPRVKTTIMTPDDYAITTQLSFFEKDLIPRILKNQIPTYIIFGNSDRKYNFDVLKKKYVDESLLKFLNNEYIPLLNSDFWLFGYSHVPLSTHHQKDWESIDNDPEETLKRNCTVKGSFSHTGKQTHGTVDTSGRTSIKKHLMKKFEKYQQEHDPSLQKKENGTNNSTIFEKMIWMTHAPPYDTPLDICSSTNHEGSKAIYDSIVAFQPLATFHGHIHETVEMSGSYFHKTGVTYSFASGNQFNTPHAHFIVFDTQSHSHSRLQY